MRERPTRYPERYLIAFANKLSSEFVDKDLKFEIWNTLTNLLNRFVEDKEINDSEELKYFTNLFLECPDKPTNYEVLNGRLIERYDGDVKDINLLRALIYDLKHLLLYEGKDTIRKIKKCSFVPESGRDHFFIASKDNPLQKYCPDCSRKNKMTRKERNKYQEGYRAEQKRRKDIRHEKEIKTLMRSEHLTRAEAEGRLKE